MLMTDRWRVARSNATAGRLRIRAYDGYAPGQSLSGALPFQRRGRCPDAVARHYSRRELAPERSRFPGLSTKRTTGLEPATFGLGSRIRGPNHPAICDLGSRMRPGCDLD